MADGGGSSAGSSCSHRGPPALDSKHKIFLSFSGVREQRAFVKQLCTDIEAIDRHPFFDINRDSLQLGEDFIKVIFEAIDQCDVGVLVLSEQYFTRTKWPMLELAAMAKRKKKENAADFTIIAVFWNISRGVCCDGNLPDEWIKTWKGWAEEKGEEEKERGRDDKIDVDKWKAALEVIGASNSLSCFDDGLDEVECRKQVVEALWDLVPPHNTGDVSYVQGKQRICEIIRKKINETQKSLSYGVRVVGLYGVGGIGKTTACMAMCNEYHNEFRGKVCHARLEDDNELEVLCDVVRRLTGTSRELPWGYNEGECRNRLNSEVHKKRVFLAVDNVSDSLEITQRAEVFLRAGYSHDSVVMVAARTLDQLRGLMIDESDCLEMPELEEAEARSLFLYHARLVENAANGEKISQALLRCRFRKGDGCNYHYHPLALRVLGVHFRYTRKVPEEDPFNPSRDGKNHPVFSIFGASFDALSPCYQRLFMDAAQFLRYGALMYFEPQENPVLKWLSHVHQKSVDRVKEMLSDLKRKALIEGFDNGGTKISMHDLLRAFAVWESGREQDGRWMYKVFGADTEPGEGGEIVGWEKLERISLTSSRGSYNVGFLDLTGCSWLTVLRLVRLNLADLELNVSGLRRLRSLELDLGCDRNSSPPSVVGLKSLKNLVYLSWRNIGEHSSCIEEIGYLENIRVLLLESNPGSESKLPDFRKLIRLQDVFLRNFAVGTVVSGLHSRMTNFRRLVFERCISLCKCDGVGDLVSLEVLSFKMCYELAELPNLQKLTNLRTFSIIGCNSITSIPGLESLVALQKFETSFCEKLVLPDLSELTNLQELHIEEIQSHAMPSVQGQHSDLVFLNKLTKLQTLAFNGWIPQGLRGVANLMNLNSLDIQGCRGVDDLVCLGSLTVLSRLGIEACDFKDMSGLRDLTALQSLGMYSCDELEVLPDMHGLSKLRSLSILGCRSLRNLSSLESVAVNVRTGRTGFSQLEFLACSGLPITEFPDLSNFPCLRELVLSSCEDLQSLSSKEPLSALCVVNIWKCKSLKALPTFTCSKHLRTFTLRSCGVSLTAHEVENLKEECPSIDISVD